MEEKDSRCLRLIHLVKLSGLLADTPPFFFNLTKSSRNKNKIYSGNGEFKKCLY